MKRHPDYSTRLLIKLPANKLAGEEGFEPSHRDPESRVLPLDDSPATDVTELKSSPPPGLLSDILPSIFHQKAAGIGQLIQSQMPNPPSPPIISPHPADIKTPIFYYLRPAVLLLKSSYQTLTRLTKKSMFLRMARAWMPACYGVGR